MNAATRLHSQAVIYTVEKLDHMLVAKRNGGVLVAQMLDLKQQDPAHGCAAAVLYNALRVAGHDMETASTLAKKYAPRIR